MSRQDAVAAVEHMLSEVDTARRVVRGDHEALARWSLTSDELTAVLADAATIVLSADAETSGFAQDPTPPRPAVEALLVVDDPLRSRTKRFSLPGAPPPSAVDEWVTSW